MEKQTTTGRGGLWLLRAIARWAIVVADFSEELAFA